MLPTVADSGSFASRYQREGKAAARLAEINGVNAITPRSSASAHRATRKPPRAVGVIPMKDGHWPTGPPIGSQLERSEHHPPLVGKDTGGKIN